MCDLGSEFSSLLETFSKLSGCRGTGMFLIPLASSKSVLALATDLPFSMTAREWYPAYGDLTARLGPKYGRGPPRVHPPCSPGHGELANLMPLVVLWDGGPKGEIT